MFVFFLLYVSKIGFGRFLTKPARNSGLPELLPLRGMIPSGSLPSVPEETHDVHRAESSGFFCSAPISERLLPRKLAIIVLCVVLNETPLYTTLESSLQIPSFFFLGA